jgi:hypothetical protein
MKREITPHKGGRTEQINLRATPETKANLEWLAEKAGISVADKIDRWTEGDMAIEFNSRQEASNIWQSQRNYTPEDAHADGVTFEEYADAMLHSYGGPERDEVHRWLVWFQEPDNEY